MREYQYYNVTSITMPSYKLLYFNAPARGEVSRMLFTLTGVPFEDKRIELHEWPAMKKGKSGGFRGARGTSPPPTQNFFLFMQFLGKIGQMVGTALGLAPPLGNPGSATDNGIKILINGKTDCFGLT